MTAPDYTARLAQFRDVLAAKAVDAWVQPVNDEFQSEYVAAYAERLPFLCGFTGSAGLGVVTRDASVPCGLLVDGRYTLQAPQEVPVGAWNVFNSGDASVVTWAVGNLPEGAVLAYDPWLHSRAQVMRWTKQLHAQGQELLPWQENLVDVVWAGKPLPPQSPLEILPERYTGESAEGKIASLCKEMQDAKLDACVITQPDAICWLLNVRAADIPFNPLLLAYALLLADGRVILLTYPREWRAEDTAYLASLRVGCHTFDAWFASSGLLQAYGLAGARIAIDPASAAHGWWLWAEKHGLTLVDAEDPVALRKACKSKAEQEGMREAHRIDGVAIGRFLSRFEGMQGCDELGVVSALEEERARGNSYRGQSFATIAGSGPNGAIVHYRATARSNRVLGQGELLLLDSGGQYLEGTTDITRTVAIGAPGEEMRDRYTRVLKGHIALASARFPKGTTGRQLDTLARQYLWEVGCDYDHGTGHGVGSYLCVHEGPQRISKKGSDVPLMPGMVLSNEPGYYKAGAYGIRIENLVMVIEEEAGLAFETLTLVPIDTSLVERRLMREDELRWLNNYHARVWAEIGPRLDGDARVWLEKACAALGQA